MWARTRAGAPGRGLNNFFDTVLLNEQIAESRRVLYILNLHRSIIPCVATRTRPRAVSLHARLSSPLPLPDTPQTESDPTPPSTD
jgi:hypothetical protein